MPFSKVRSRWAAFAYHLTTIKLAGYAWGQLPEGSLIVDVGGGVGSLSLVLANHHPHLRFIVQDREPVVLNAVGVCALLFAKLSKV